MSSFLHTLFLKHLWKCGFLLMTTFSAVFLSSCDNDACKEPMYTSIHMLFYSLTSPTTSADLDTFSVFFVNKDGSLSPTDYIDTFNISQIHLPLSYDSNITKFYFSNRYLHDTIIVNHTNSDEFVSAECGTRVVSHIDSLYFARGHFQDSISVTNPSVSGSYNGQNVKIYIE